MKTIKIALNDDILTGLVTEQLSRLQGVKQGEEKPDLVIASELTPVKAPHLILGSAKGDENSENLSLPLRAGDLTDRIRYILSGRDRFALGEMISFLTYTLNAEDGIMTDTSSGKTARLTDKEKLIMFLLHAAPDKSMDRKSLLHAVWGYVETVETHTLETHLYRLRQKLEETFGATDMIATKDGIYTLKA